MAGFHAPQGVEEVKHDVPDGTRSLTLDVTQRGDIHAAINRSGDKAGRLNVLVNNAVVSPEQEPITEADSDQLDRAFSVNSRRPTLLVKHAVASMLVLDTGGPASSTSRRT